MQVDGDTIPFGTWKFLEIDGRLWRFFTKISNAEFPVIRRGLTYAFLHQLVGHLTVRNEPAFNA